MDFTKVAGFDWDEGNRTHRQTHGLAHDEIESVFRDHPKVAPDQKHAETEIRFVAVGRTRAGRMAFVVFTLRGGRIRPSSARYMHAREIVKYETSNPEV